MQKETCQLKKETEDGENFIFLITKSRLNVEFVKKTTLEMVIGQQMKEEEHNQNY